ncbi:MAG: hypothetical protein EXR75_11820 [Myxococcales bacterium]|nr:hypothetical protein [Myxococcales bacterium]
MPTSLPQSLSCEQLLAIADEAIIPLLDEVTGPTEDVAVTVTLLLAVAPPAPGAAVSSALQPKKPAPSSALVAPNQVSFRVSIGTSKKDDVDRAASVRRR